MRFVLFCETSVMSTPLTVKADLACISFVIAFISTVLDIFPDILSFMAVREIYLKFDPTVTI